MSKKEEGGLKARPFPPDQSKITNSYNEDHTKLLLKYVQLKERKNKIEKELEEHYGRILDLYRLSVLNYDPSVIDINVTESKARIAWKEKYREALGEGPLKDIEKDNKETTIRIWVSKISADGKRDAIPPQYRDKVPFKLIK